MRSRWLFTRILGFSLLAQTLYPLFLVKPAWSIAASDPAISMDLSLTEFHLASADPAQPGLTPPASPLHLAQAAGRLQFWQFNPDQNRLEFRTDQGVQPRARLISDPVRLVIDLPNTILPNPAINQQVGQGAIRGVRVSQFDPQTTRIVVEVIEGFTLDPQQIRVRGLSPTQWTVQLPTPQPINPSLAPGSDPTIDPLSGRVPENPATISQPPPSPNLPPEVAPPLRPPVNGAPAIVRGVNLDDRSNRLVIQADRGITYQTGWERATGFYRIVIPNARLDERLEGPQLDSDSPLLRVRVRQEDANTVILLLQMAPGVSISRITQPDRQSVALQLQQRSLAGLRTPVITSPPIRNGRQVVVIDPGHGGSDPGAIGIAGLREVDVVLPISLEVASILERQGIQVVLTRQDDRDVELEPRVQIAERVNADVFISIHANAISMSRPDVNGIETFYFSTGLGLAQSLQSSMVRATGMRDRGVKRARFYVLRRTSMPSALVEVGFVTGADDAPRLASPQWRSMMANAIAQGIIQYLQRR